MKDPNAVRPPRRRWALLGVAALFCLCFCLLAFPVQKVSDCDASVQSLVSLRAIAAALHNYHAAFRKLPPAVVRDKEGRPLYSWRVLILQYLDEDEVYLRFKSDEPWDGPHNRALLAQTPRCYLPAGGGDDGPGLTRYLAFVGPGTAFERDGLRWADFPDGLSSTLLVVEAAEPVPWSKPADLAYDPAKPLPPLGGAFTKPVYYLGIEVGRREGFAACFADGSTRFVDARTDEATLRALITRNGGEKVDVSKLE